MAGANSYAYASAQTEIGLALETTRGTPGTTFYWIKAKEPKYAPKRTLIPDDTLQGSMVDVYDLVPGLRYDSHGWSGYPRMDSFPLFLAGELGSPDNLTAAPSNTTIYSGDGAAAGATTIDTTDSIAANSWIVIGSGATLETHETTAVTGTAAPYTVTLKYPLVYGQPGGAAITGLTGHSYSLLNNVGKGNQPPSLTIVDWDGDQWRQLTAAQVDKLTIKGNASGLVEYTTDFFANPSVTPAPDPVPAFTTEQAIPGWTFAVAINDVILGYVLDWEVQMSRKVKPIPALQGTQEYYLYFANALESTAKVTVIDQQGSPQLAQFQDGTVISVDIVCFNVTNGDAMNLHTSKAMWKTGELARGKEETTVQLELQMLPTTTDALAGGVSPVKCTVANTQTTAYNR